MGGTSVAVKPSRQDLLKHFESMDSTGSYSKTNDSQSHQSSHLRRRQLQEDLSALVKLRSPFVCQTIGALIEKKSVMMVFEYMENGNLSNLLASSNLVGREGRPFEVQWACQIAKGLDFLHNVAPPLGPLLHEDLTQIINSGNLGPTKTSR